MTLPTPMTVSEARDFLGLAAEGPATISVPEAGAIAFDLSRNGSYDAAHRDEIPTVRVGRLLRAPVIALALKVISMGAANPPDAA